MTRSIDRHEGVALWDSVWSLRVVVLGLLLPALVRGLTALAQSWRHLVSGLTVWLIVFVPPILLMVVLPLVSRQPRGAPLLRPSKRTLAIELLVYLPIAVVCLVVLYSYVEIVTRYAPESRMGTASVEGMMRWPSGPALYSFLFFMVIVGPICEEIFYRGFLYNAFRRRMPAALAVVLQAVIFGFSHPYPMAGVGSVTVLGVCLAAAYHWRKTILAPILVHAFFNGLIALQILAVIHTNADMAVVGIGPQHDGVGCIIESVTDHSPAAESGLQPGDDIIEFGDYSILNSEHLYTAVRLYNPGDVVTVLFERDGQTWEVDVELVSRQTLAERWKDEVE